MHIEKSQVCLKILLTRKVHWRFVRIVIAIPGKFQHALEVADMDMKEIMKVV